MKYFLSLFFIVRSFACSDFLLNDSEGGVVVGRSMEFATPMHSQIEFFYKGREFVSIIEGGKQGMKWDVKYNFLGINCFHTPILTDGMNEAGLAVDLLWFPPTKYPSYKKSDPKRTLAFEDIAFWLLSTFESAEEAVRAMETIQIWAHPLPQFGGEPPVHIVLHDAKGKSYVIEFVDGEMKTHFNPVGVTTNAPAFPWQLQNLSCFINLSAKDAKSLKLGSAIIHEQGQGGGMVGLPGDITPASRFVRIAMQKDSALRATSAQQNVNKAWHLLNTVDIPLGTSMTRDGKISDYTQWAVVKDLTNCVMHYRSYEDLSPKSVSFSKRVQAPVPLSRGDQ